LPGEDPNRQPKLHRRALARQRLPEPSVQFSLGPSDEALALLEKDPQPGMVVLSQEVRDHDGPHHAITEKTVG
jgi:hypothetical protein